MKTTILGLAVASMFATSGVASASEVHEPMFVTDGHFAMVSDYRKKGISQSNENAAVQGNFKITHDTGIYLDNWGSSTAMGANGVELQHSVGWSTSIAHLDVDGGMRFYNFDGTDIGADGNYNEFYGSIGVWGVEVGADWTSNYKDGDTNVFYLGADAGWELGRLGVAGHIGRSFSDMGVIVTGVDEVLDYSLEGSVRIHDSLHATVAWVGTDLDDATTGVDDSVVFGIRNTF